MLRSSAEMFATFLNISSISYDCQNMLVAKVKMGTGFHAKPIAFR